MDDLFKNKEFTNAYNLFQPTTMNKKIEKHSKNFIKRFLGKKFSLKIFLEVLQKEVKKRINSFKNPLNKLIDLAINVNSFLSFICTFGESLTIYNNNKNLYENKHIAYKLQIQLFNGLIKLLINNKKIGELVPCFSINFADTLLIGSIISIFQFFPIYNYLLNNIIILNNYGVLETSNEFIFDEKIYYLLNISLSNFYLFLGFDKNYKINFIFSKTTSKLFFITKISFESYYFIFHNNLLYVFYGNKKNYISLNMEAILYCCKLEGIANLLSFLGLNIFYNNNPGFNFLIKIDFILISFIVSYKNKKWEVVIVFQLTTNDRNITSYTKAYIKHMDEKLKSSNYLVNY